MALTLASLISQLNKYWLKQNYLIVNPIDIEVGAGTSHHHTFFHAIHPSSCNLVFIQPSRRPNDCWSGLQHNKLYVHTQYQVISKPCMPDMIQQFYQSILQLSSVFRQAMFYFNEDNWANATLGAYGLGWEVCINQIEVAQLTVFQRMGGLICKPQLSEITYGLERILMLLQPHPTIYQTWLTQLIEQEQMNYCISYTNLLFLKTLVKLYKQEIHKLLHHQFVFPSYELLLKLNHVFNMLDAKHCLTSEERLQLVVMLRHTAGLIAKQFVRRYIL